MYLKFLGDAAARHRCAVHAYVLMPNHVHLLVTPTEGGAVGAMMQDLGRRYVRIFNDIHQRTGTLWEGRYKAAMVDTERYFLTCQRYIELNPVRAALVDHPASFRWSTYRHYALGAKNLLVSAHELVMRLAIDEATRREAYAALFDEPLSAEALDKIRCCTNKGWAIGSDEFVQWVEKALGRPAKAPPRGRPKNAMPEAQDPTTEMLI
jgi:putative transposase